MIDPNAPQVDNASDNAWTATLQRWSGESEDLALPIPINVQLEMGLTENSMITAAFVDGQLVISEIGAKLSACDFKTNAKD